jgi:DNA ligase 1
MNNLPLPMLASKGDVPHDKLEFPKYISPKLDGVRAMVHDGKVYSRTHKLIPNKHVQELFGKSDYNGYDGELIVGTPTDQHVFKNTMSGVMTTEGKPDVSFYVFDRFDMPDEPYYSRYDSIYSGAKDRVYCLHQLKIKDINLMKSTVAWHLELGYEGSMLRNIGALYKNGRATDKSQDLMKLKAFADAEAVIIGADEMMHNLNEFNEGSIKKRSTHKAGLKGAGMLGGFKVRGLNGPFKDIEFAIGAGLTQAERIALWGKKLNGRIIKYRYFEGGVDVRPRFPVFLGFRDKKDL